MRISIKLPCQILLALGLVFSTAGAQEQAPKLGELEEQLFELKGDKAQFLTLLQKAKELGLSKQVSLELRFLFFAENEDEEGIANLADELRAAVAEFNPDESKVFSTKEAFLSVVFYAEALKALGEGNHGKFEKSIKEAFWNSPAQAGIFAEPIERLRTFEAIKRVNIDMDLTFEKQADRETTSLAELIGDGKGLLLHFWSPWHRECEVSVPDMANAAESLVKLGWATAMVLPQQGEEQLEEASQLREASSKAPVNWLLDRRMGSLSAPLRIDHLPMTVVLNPGGKVLFHGDTGSEEMWVALKALDPRVQGPQHGSETKEHETP